MTGNSLAIFDKTLGTTNGWRDEFMADLGPDRQVAWKVLSVVLRKLRDRLPLGLAAHLGAQLPLLVRGIYYDQFEPGKLPTECDTHEEFVAEVAGWLSDIRPVDPHAAVASVFRVLAHHIDPGQIMKVREALPRSMRQAWENAAAVEPV